MPPIKPKTLKQEGESCGVGYWEIDCGKCDQGLKCEERPSLRDACGVCQPKDIYPKPGELYNINTDSTL